MNKSHVKTLLRCTTTNFKAFQFANANFIHKRHSGTEIF
jgi:hypothetical protein